VVRHYDATFDAEGLVFPPNSYVPLGEWVYYNFAAESFLSKKPFIPKKEKFTFWANLWETCR